MPDLRTVNAVMRGATPTPFLLRLFRRALADEWEATRQAIACADGTEREALEARQAEIETALAYAEMDLRALAGPSFSNHLAQRRERAAIAKAMPPKGPRHG